MLLLERGHYYMSILVSICLQSWRNIRLSSYLLGFLCAEFYSDISLTPSSWVMDKLLLQRYWVCCGWGSFHICSCWQEPKNSEYKPWPDLWTLSFAKLPFCIEATSDWTCNRACYTFSGARRQLSYRAMNPWVLCLLWSNQGIFLVVIHWVLTVKPPLRHGYFADLSLAFNLEHAIDSNR